MYRKLDPQKPTRKRDATKSRTSRLWEQTFVTAMHRITHILGRLSSLPIPRYSKAVRCSLLSLTRPDAMRFMVVAYCNSDAVRALIRRIIFITSDRHLRGCEGLRVDGGVSRIGMVMLTVALVSDRNDTARDIHRKG